MRIVYCIAGTRHSGGMERVLANKANWLVAHGHDVSIVTTDQHGEESYFKMDSRIRHYDLGINYEDNNGKAFLNKLCKYPFKQWKHRRRLSELIKRLRPDVAISMFCNEASLMPSINDGSAKVLEIHFSRFKRLQYGRKGIWRIADRLRSHHDIKTVSSFDKFIVLTEEDRNYWGELPNIAVIPNAVTLKVSPCYNATSRKVIAVGRLDYQKGFERLVKAWKPVAVKHTDWQLHIYGDGRMRNELVEMITEFGLQETIFIHKPTPEIVDRYMESSFLVMSSRYEGLPMVLIEAQTCGLPIVSFDCKCGPKDIIDNGQNGLLVKEGDITSLSEAILSLIENPAVRAEMSAASKKKASLFDEDVIMNRWVRLFQSLI